MIDPDQPDQNQKDRPPLALAAEWVAKISTVVSEMVFPAIIGAWLDGRWKTNYLALVGVVLGVSLGIWHLIRMAKDFK